MRTHCECPLKHICGIVGLINIHPAYVSIFMDKFFWLKALFWMPLRFSELEGRNAKGTYGWCYAWSIRQAFTCKKDMTSPYGVYLPTFQELGDEQLRDLEKQRQEHKLGILLVGISVLFICCQSFKIVPDLYEIMFCPDDSICYTTDFINTIVNLSHLLVCFNSSANFVIYLLGMY